MFGSADLWDAMHTNILPCTFSVGCPHVVVTSTPGNLRPMDSTVLKLLLCGIARCPIVMHDRQARLNK